MINNDLKELPENWYITITEENTYILNNWRKTVSKPEFIHHNCPNGAIILNCHPDKSFYYYNEIEIFIKNHKNNITSNPIEISFDQFKKWILKEGNITTNFIEGEVYYLEYFNEYCYIAQYNKGNHPEDFDSNNFISINFQSLRFSGFFLTSNGNYKIRLATKEEKEWLNACIASNKYIPLEEFLTSLKEEFKKGDYIVILHNSNYSPFHSNYIYKQNENCFHLSAKTDSNSNSSTWSLINFANKHLWRYANKEEIEHYNKIQKPYHVDDIIKCTNIESELISDLSNTKIYIGDNPKLSELVQMKAFDLGWRWAINNNKITYIEKKVLFFWKDKYISWGNDLTNSPCREIFPKDLGIKIEEKEEIKIEDLTTLMASWKKIHPLTLKDLFKVQPTIKNTIQPKLLTYQVKKLKTFKRNKNGNN